MNERIEAWRAQEKLRTDIGWLAVFLGIGGAGVAIAALLGLCGVGNDTSTHALSITLLLGIGTLVSAVGLWRARPWSRWVSVAYLALLFGEAVVELVRERAFSGALFGAPLVIIYLLLPSTGRRFDRAQRLRQPKP